MEREQELQIVKYLSVILAIASAIILYKEYFFRVRISPVQPLSNFPKVEINLKIFQTKEFKSLLPVETISFPRKLGRSNPFAQYTVASSIATTSTSSFKKK